jgi:FdhE protein
MSQGYAELTNAYRPWPDRRRRTAELRSRQPFAEDVLALYAGLLGGQERAWDEATSSGVEASGLMTFLTDRVLPGVVEATMSAGPEKLRQALPGRLHSADLDDLFLRWLESKEQAVVDRYLARAALSPVLEARPDLRSLCTGPRDERHCPSCGGLPQLSYLGFSDEALVSGPRYLLCSRCEASWIYPRLACPACGEQSAPRLQVLEEEGEATFRHLRIDVCESCSHYLLCVDLRKDAAAVPLVDELAATPLHLFAQDRGLTRVVPNLMGF